MKNILKFAVLTGTLCLLLTSCGNEEYMGEGWLCQAYPGTGIVPQEGIWKGEAGYKRINFTVTGSRWMLLQNPHTGYLDHNIQFANGSFSFYFGQIGGTHCPIDSFCISGSFTSETEASGVLHLAYACNITDSFAWTAKPLKQ